MGVQVEPLATPYQDVPAGTANISHSAVGRKTTVLLTAQCLKEHMSSFEKAHRKNQKMKRNKCGR
jgi:hypothetical protein